MNCSIEKSQEISIDNYTDNALDKKITAKSLFLFSLPSIIGMVFMNLYTMVDGMFVSRFVGTDALSAINIVFPIIMTVIAISTMLSTGGNAIISKKIGERKENEARKDFSTIVFISIALSIIISLLSFIFINPLLKVLGDNDRLHKIYKLSLIGIIVTSILVFMFGLLKSDLLVSIFTSNGTNVYKLSNIGLKLFSISFLFMGLNLFTSALFTALSDGKISAIISLLRTLVFIVISVLVLPLLIGINGVWLSVPVAELLSLIVSIFYLKKYKSKYKYA